MSCFANYCCIAALRALVRSPYQSISVGANTHGNVGFLCTLEEIEYEIVRWKRIYLPFLSHISFLVQVFRRDESELARPK